MAIIDLPRFFFDLRTYGYGLSLKGLADPMLFVLKTDLSLARYLPHLICWSIFNRIKMVWIYS